MYIQSFWAGQWCIKCGSYKDSTTQRTGDMNSIFFHFQMKYVVYFPDEKQVVAVDPEDFVCPNFTLKDLDELNGEMVYGVCYYDKEAYQQMCAFTVS